MSFLGRAIGQLLNRWMTDTVANSSAMRKTAKVAVKGMKGLKGSAATAGEKAGAAVKDVKSFANDFWGELKNQTGVKLR